MVKIKKIKEIKRFQRRAKKPIPERRQWARRVMSKYDVRVSERGNLLWIKKGGIYVPIEADLRDKFIQDCIKNQNLSKSEVRDILFEILKERPLLRSSICQSVNFIPLNNGIYEISTRKFIPWEDNKKRVFIKKHTLINYKWSRKCLAFARLLDQIMLEEDIPVFQEMLGYLFYKRYIFQKVFIFTGIGSNGKSVLLNIISHLLGDGFVSHLSLTNINDSHLIGDLYMKLANINSELPEERLVDNNSFKALTGNDRVTANPKHRDPFPFVNYAKFIFACNDLPKVKDAYSYFRRIVVFPFNNTFWEKQDYDKLKEQGDLKNTDFLQDPFVADKILKSKEEISGIFNWAMEGLDRLLRNGRFTYQKTVEETRDLYYRIHDGITLFTKTCLSLGEYDFISKDDMYVIYCKYCDKMRIPKESKEKVGRALKKLGVEEIRRRIGKERIYGWQCTVKHEE